MIRYYVDVVTSTKTYEYIVYAPTKRVAIMRARAATAAKTTARLLDIGISERPHGLENLPVLGRPSDAPARGRVRLSDLRPGDAYYAVCSRTGVCVYRTRSASEAQEVVGRNPDRLEATRHVRI